MADALEGLSEDDLTELQLYRDFETDALIEAGFLSSDVQQSHPLDIEVVFKHTELDLHIKTGRYYPACSITWHVENYKLPRVSIIELRDSLKQVAEAAEPANNLEKWKVRHETMEGIFEPSMVVLDLARTTKKHLEDWRPGKPSVAPTRTKFEVNHLPFDVKATAFDYTSKATTKSLAHELLGKTPQEICLDYIPDRYRVLHVEEVIRADLAASFAARRHKLREELSEKSYGSLKHFVPAQSDTGRKSDLIDYLTRPRMTFHGTQRQFVQSIVRYGFLPPGSKNPGTGVSNDIRCGSTYGRGIYSSPSADFSLSYSGALCHKTEPNQFFGIKLLVCATLMGRTAQVFRADNWRDQSRPYPGSDSHTANDGFEYIVFESAQIIPVYVIHIDWGSDNALHFEKLPDDPTSYRPSGSGKTHPRLLNQVIWPADAERARLAAFQRASKYFPYGFGPATGGRFVIEEVGEIDDDEEEYGEYQRARHDEAEKKANRNMDYWSWAKVGHEEDMAIAEQEAVDNGIDEYSVQRNTNAHVGSRGMGKSEAPTDWERIPLPDELIAWRGYKEDNEEGDDFGLDRLLMTTDNDVTSAQRQ
ncbi:ADP-ribosylation [Xylariaceae sp. FL0255]|nr:ADP-ribosylation [Xylariaceae sp. FL0255]